MQEALGMRFIDELKHVHLIHSVIEMLITLVIIVLRMINARMGYIDVQVAIQRLQRFDPVHEPHLRAVWTWMWFFVAAGVLDVLVCVVCFVVFDQIAHLGWTVLSNQACIVLIKQLSEFYETRVNAAVKTIKEDQNKAS